MSAPTRATDTPANVFDLVLTINAVMLEAIAILESLSGHKVIYSLIRMTMTAPKSQQKRILF